MLYFPDVYVVRFVAVNQLITDAMFRSLMHHAGLYSLLAEWLDDRRVAFETLEEYPVWLYAPVSLTQD